MPQPEHLGRVSNDPITTLDTIPAPAGALRVTLEAVEVTSLCPVTAQPDFGTLRISYEPNGALVETKSLKLFLWSFRNRALFTEALVAEVADAFFAQIEPHSVEVAGEFNLRGGISVRPTASRKPKS